ncbi:hypothetical protein [Paenibacillus sp. FSL R10-2734]|uniref:hypothetical protein n=1 Tax=Paenibacillus sp. FSL R10-2734 TaxID=2954691 RepID=UPI0030D8CAA0
MLKRKSRTLMVEVMLDKINLLINVSLFPFQNLRFFGQQDILQVLEYEGESSEAIWKRESARKKIQRKLHDEILRKAKPNSLDEINLMFQKFYPMLCSEREAKRHGFAPKHPGDDEGHLHVEKKLYQHYFQILEEFSDALISYRDGDVIFKYWKNDANGHKHWRFIDFMDRYKGQDKVHFFHSLSRFIPLDLMVTLHHSKNNIHDPIQLQEFYQHVNLADAPLDDILGRGVAENHIHASAAFNFSILWQMVMNNICPPKYFDKFEPNHLAASSEVQEYILTARLLRLVLTLYLKEQAQDLIDPNSQYHNQQTEPLSLYEWLESSFVESSETQKMLFNLVRNQDNQFASIDQLNEAIDRIQIYSIGSDDISPIDFVYGIFPEYQHIKTYGENIFLQKVISYKRNIVENYKLDGHFEQFFRVFFKYISIKNEFYQQVTQPTVMHGLDFFRGYFDRATEGILENQDYFTIMLRTLFQNRYLRKIELRISIKDSEEQNRRKLLHILKSYEKILIDDYRVNEDPNVDFPLIGIVYHLIKRPDDMEKDISLYDEERDHTLKGLHFGEHQEQYIKQVKMVQQLRKNVPMVTNFIVGLDAASLENNTPVQVFAPVFEEARDSQYDSLRIKDPEGNILPSQSLFFTFHAGEEFRHLNSGLRRMDEVIDYCKLHAGDRIGHGIALGVNIEEWIRRNPLVIMPRGEYLDNLLWTWGVYSRTTKLQTETLVYLERRIYEVASFLFSDVIHAGELRVSTLFEVYKRRFKRVIDEAKILNKVKTERTKEEGIIEEAWRNSKHYQSAPKSVDKLYESYHQEDTLHKMNEPIYVDINEIEHMMATDMQNYLIHKIASIGIVIEVNPSSNEAIGEINSMFGNQLFKIQSAGNRDLANILVNVNSDDPMVFNTNVSNELVYLYYGMLQQGIGREAALDWIEKLRKSGMDTSFIRGTRSRKEYLRILNMTIKALEDPYYC